TPVYKSKPIISKQYSQESEVKKGKKIDNKEALILAVRLKALNGGFQLVVDRECIGDNPNLLFISDRHAAISLVVEKEFPLAFHAVCCRHLMMNLSLKNKKRKYLYWKICKAYTREDFAISMTTLQNVQHDAYQKLCEAGVERWSRAHCPLVRYNYMTSNSVESVNAKSVIHRKEPVLKLAETYRAMVQECTISVWSRHSCDKVYRADGLCPICSRLV
ncbi:transposase, MuDR, MULE transposase domain protein, partial [Tanacetum coccineum]